MKIVIKNESEKVIGYTNFQYFRGDESTALLAEVPDDFNMEEWKVVDGQLIAKTPEEIEAEKLPVVQAEKHIEITAERDRRIMDGFNYQTFDIHTDPTALSNYNTFLTKQSAGLYAETGGVYDSAIIIKAKGTGKYLLITTPQELFDFTTAVEAFVNDQYAESWTVKDQIDGAGTVEEVEALFNNYMGV